MAVVDITKTVEDVEDMKAIITMAEKRLETDRQLKIAQLIARDLGGGR